MTPKFVEKSVKEKKIHNNFDFHVNTLLKKASKKYHALARVYNYMNKKKRRILMNAFITSQFSYCPLV